MKRPKPIKLDFAGTSAEGKKVPLEGLLVDFINDKAASYVKPTRKGTARGDPIGMKDKKYVATLLALTNIRVKDQATQLKIPEKLLGKWRSERPFQEMVIKHIDEFDKKIFSPYIVEYVSKEFDRLTEARRLPVAEYAEFDSNNRPAPHDGFGDRTIYDDVFIDFLGDYIGDLIDEKAQKDLYLAARIETWRMRQDFRGLPRVTEKDKARHQKLRPEIIDAIKAIFVKDEITDDDRKRAIDLLEWLRRE